MRPGVEGVDLIRWVEANRVAIEELLTGYGAILFRDFTVQGVSPFEQLIEALSGGLLDYTYRSTPRKQISGRIYTSTEYPADQSIPLHNELSYATAWPMKIWFYCMQPATTGGETPIADSRRVAAGIDPAISERFAHSKLMYVRNYGEGIDLPWQEVFQTASKAQVEETCRTAGLELEWKVGDRLRTRQLCQAVENHPKTGERVWFNQAHLFHISRLSPVVRESLLSTFAEEDLPRNVYYGDGSPIESSVLDHISDVYQQNTVAFPWQQGDILLLDNMLTAHGRRPFAGERKVVVGMAEMIHPQG
jgi:alpha-ketoglutarate-dependent taurine dioxygenase